MTPTDPEVLDGVLALLAELAEDWDHEGEIGPQTSFIRDLGLQSLDIVVLGTLVQERYGRLPYAAFLDELGQRPVEERDLTVAELAAFICANRRPQFEEA